MTVGRVVSSVAASLAVAGCAVVVLGMTRARGHEDAAEHTTPTPVASSTSRPATIDEPPASSTAAPSSAPAVTRAAGTATHPAPALRTSAAPVLTRAASPSVSTSAPAQHAVTRPVIRTSAPAPRPTHSSSTPAPRPQAAQLPLGYARGDATRIITVVAHSSYSTTATVQAWDKVSGGWRRHGSSVTAYVGADGIGRASETTSKTPAGSYTLTQAFGYYGNPGTGLPYFRTTWADWWISTPGAQYNTHQRCSSCGYRDPDEHLVTETPYYNYAVVIDYNTRNAPGGVRTGAGSAFFLHVSVGSPTAGCVAIPQDTLVSLMRWLTPSAHPRIMIGVA